MTEVKRTRFRRLEGGNAHKAALQYAWAWMKKAGRSAVIAVKGFKDDRCTLRASALTFYSLLSIVPVVAMAFGIAKGFGFQKLLERELMARFYGQEEVAMRIIEFSNGLLSETKGGIMAAIGVLFLLWTVIKTFSHIEESFNSIWLIQEGRSLIRKFTDYLALFFTAPMLLIFSGSITVFIKTHLTQIMSGSGVPEVAAYLVSGIIKCLPYGTMWLLFTFLYLFIPNKKIDIRAAFAGGVIAGTVYQVGQILYISFQVGVSHYNAIYGSFAALPLFLIWLQASWLILLFGAEIAYSWENPDLHGNKGDGLSLLSIRIRKLLSLRITMMCVSRFARGDDPVSEAVMAKELDIPLRTVRTLVPWLVACRILSEVNTPDGPCYQPARDIESLSILSVIKALEETGESVPTTLGTLEYEALEDALGTFETVASQSPGERLLKDI